MRKLLTLLFCLCLALSCGTYAAEPISVVVPLVQPTATTPPATFPQVVSSNSGFSNANLATQTLNLPASIVAGNLLICAVSIDGAGATGTWPNEGTEWIELTTTLAGVGYGFTAAYKIAAGTEGATIVFDNSGTEQSSHVCWQIGTWHGTTPPAIAVSAEGSNNSPDPPSLDPAGWASENTLWIAIAGVDNAGGSIPTSCTFPTNYTANQVDEFGANNTGTTICTATREVAAASEDPGVFTYSPSTGARPWFGITIAVRP